MMMMMMMMMMQRNPVDKMATKLKPPGINKYYVTYINITNCT
jgi:hypothetical protein